MSQSDQTVKCRDSDLVKFYTDARHGDIREILQKLKSRICQVGLMS